MLKTLKAMEELLLILSATEGDRVIELQRRSKNINERRDLERLAGDIEGLTYEVIKNMDRLMAEAKKQEGEKIGGTD